MKKTLLFVLILFAINIQAQTTETFHDFNAVTIRGDSISLSIYAGKKSLWSIQLLIADSLHSMRIWKHCIFNTEDPTLKYLDFPAMILADKNPVQMAQ